MSAPRVLHIIDDDPLVREHAAILAEARGWRACKYEGGPAFLEGQARATPGCILLDMQMPQMSGIEVLQALVDRTVEWPTIMLTAQGEVRVAVEAMKRGAFEFVQKPYDPQALMKVLDAAFEHFESLSQERQRRDEAKALVASLSGREHQVLRGMLASLPNKLIAHALDLSPRTVEIYRSKVMDKLHVRGLSAAVRLALLAGVTPLESKEDS